MKDIAVLPITAESAVASINFIHLKMNLLRLQSHGAIALMEIVWIHFHAVRKFFILPTQTVVCIN